MSYDYKTHVPAIPKAGDMWKPRHGSGNKIVHIDLVDEMADTIEWTPVFAATGRHSGKLSAFIKKYFYVGQGR